MANHLLRVPASLSDVREFLNGERERFVRDYQEVFGLVSDRLRRLPVYKVYGRDERQGGDLLKHPRKVRLKFNDYHAKRNEASGSLWNVPDIVGFTVVVTYPSDISKVCAVLDALIDGRKLSSTSENPGPSKAVGTIRTRHGRPIEKGGYFACHYNVRKRRPGNQGPVCEIQIKTVLHDAWGAKTHDLTYKPAGRTDRDMIESFNALGDTLAKIDQQSDLLRRSIEGPSSVRESKRRRVQVAVIEQVAMARAAGRPLQAALLHRIESLVGDEDDAAIANLVECLFEAFEDDKAFACFALCLLAVRRESDAVFQQALEAFDLWFEDAEVMEEKARRRSVSALAAYSGGDVSSAIEYGEQALATVRGVDRTGMVPAELRKLDRLANSILASLAYYHADRVGSHEGELASSGEQAKRYLAESTEFRLRLALLPDGLESAESDIRAALSNQEISSNAFNTLDNEAFVRIQTAASEEELRHAYAKLLAIHAIHKETQPPTSSAAAILLDYHDYCARARLAELERA